MSIAMHVPFSAPVRSIQLRDPDFNNIEEHSTTFEFVTTMDGALHGRRHTPATKKLAWTFSALDRNKAVELRDFIEAAAGEFVRLAHFDGTTWKVKFLTEVPEITTGTAELSSVFLEMEGAPL